MFRFRRRNPIAAAAVEVEPPVIELPIVESPAAAVVDQPPSSIADFLTPEESAVFSEPYIPAEEPGQPSQESTGQSPTSHWPIADHEPSE